jgi:hypothetical protein
MIAKDCQNSRTISRGLLHSCGYVICIRWSPYCPWVTYIHVCNRCRSRTSVVSDSSGAKLLNLFHIFTIFSDYGRVIGFIELLDTARDYTLEIIITYTLLTTDTSPLPLFGNGFQRRTFHFLWVPELSLCLSYQLLTATAHNDWLICT